MRARVSTRSRSRALTAISLGVAVCLGSSIAAAAAASPNASSQPRILAGFSTSERLSLRRAFGLAEKKIQKSDRCRVLFDGLEIDGVEALRRTFYEPAAIRSDVVHCQQGAVALTGLGGRRTRLCANFKLHSLRDQAGILIHEALHVAGMSEKPIDPDGMTPHQINQWVKKACGL